MLLVLFCIGVFLILQYYEIDTLVPIDSTLLAMPFFIAGYEMKEFFKRDLSFYVVLIIFVALIVFNYYNGRVDINTCQIGNSLLLFYLTYIIHSGFISGYQNRYGDNLKPPTNVYHRMTA